MKAPRRREDSRSGPKRPYPAEEDLTSFYVAGVIALVALFAVIIVVMLVT